MKAFVYWNLHKNVWSVKATSGEFKGKVVAHSERVTLFNATPKVSEAGRVRVIKEQRKNVHAGIVGEVTALGGDFDMKYGLNVRDILYQHTHGIDNNGLFPTSLDSRKLYYNPYFVKRFMYSGTTEPFLKAGVVLLSNNKQVFAFDETEGE